MKNMRKFLKNTLAFLCTLAMLVTSIGISHVVTVFAESTGGRGNIQYRYYDTVEKTFKAGTVPAEAKIVDSTYTRTDWGDETGKETWYVVKGEVNLLYIYASGKLNLVLCDKAKLTVEQGMVMLKNGSSINIYAQSDGSDMGEIISTGLESKRPAIGTGDDGNVNGTTCTTNIHGGKITATGAKSTAGIGGDSSSRVGIINIYGGEIKAQGGERAAAIGGGFAAASDGINIYGGKITATGGEDAAGIGGGLQYGSGGGPIKIYGGQITARAGHSQRGIVNQPVAIGNGGLVNSATANYDVFLSWTDEQNDYIDANRHIHPNNIGNGKSSIEIDSAHPFKFANTGEFVTLENIKKGGKIVPAQAAICSVTFETGEGATKVEPQGVNKGGKIKPTVTPVRKGHRFAGWQKDGSPFDISTVILDDTILTAMWNPLPDTEYQGEGDVKVELAGADYYPLEPSHTVLEGGTWVVVDNNTSFHERITIKGDVNIILADGKILTADRGIAVTSKDKSNLSIYAQNKGTGTLKAFPDEGQYSAGIGGDDGKRSCGTINIHGGRIQASGSELGAAIGGSAFGNGGTIRIYGGQIDAQGSKDYGEAIGFSNAGGTEPKNADITLGWSRKSDYIRLYSASGGQPAKYKGNVTLSKKFFLDGTETRAAWESADKNNINNIKIVPKTRTIWLDIQEKLEEGESIKLISDVSAKSGDAALVVPEGKNAAIDLNGYTINCQSDLTGDVKEAILVKDNAALKIISENGVGSITGKNAHIKNLGTLTLDNVKISGIEGNEAIKNDGTLSLKNVSITGNHGGVSVGDKGVLKLSEKVIIKDNAKGSVSKNAVGNLNKKINFEEPLTSDSRIGLEDMETILTNGAKGKAVPGNFVSDTGNRYIYWTEDGSEIKISAQRPMHNINIAELTGKGTVTAEIEGTTGNVSKVAEGAKVILKVKPEAGWWLNSLIVKKGETPVVLAADNSFTMPDGDVTVMAIFEQVKNAPFTAPTAKANLVYTGSEQELINVGSVEVSTGEFRYSLTKEGEYKTEIPKAKDVGSYEVYYKVIGTNPKYIYNNAKGKLTVNINKANQAVLAIKDVTGKKYGDADFTLETTGGSGTGEVAYSLSLDNSVLSINGSTAKIIGVGEVTVKAVKAGDNNYNEARTELKITIAKGDTPAIIFPTASNLTYGQKLSESILTGGSTKYGTFTWAEGNIIPTVNNTGYEVVFIPSEKTKKNYEEITDINKKKNILITVSKAAPTVNLTANVSENTGSKAVTLLAEITGASGVYKPTGNIKFFYKNGVTFTELSTVALTGGKVSYKWENVADNKYEIKAEYLGDGNYNAIESAVKEIDTRKQSQSDISFTDIPDKIYGDGEFTLSIIGGSGTGVVTYSVPANNGVLEISGNKAKIIGAGTVTITAKKAADDTYNEVSRSISITVAKKKLKVKAEDKTVVKGKLMPIFTYNKVEVDKSLATGDTFTNPDITSDAVNTNYTGEYDITISGGTLKKSDGVDAKNNYEIIYQKGKLTIVDAVYEVKVIDGTGSGNYAKGQTVNITAKEKSGYAFTGWTGSDGVVFANASVKETSFVMPAKAVTVKANYRMNSSGNSSGGNSSSGDLSGSNSPESHTSKDKDSAIIKTEKAPDLPIAVEITVKAKKGAKKTAKADISGKIVENAIKKAKEEAKKNGKKVDEIALEINIVMPKGIDRVKVNLSKSALGKVASGAVKSFTVNGSSVKAVFNKKAIFKIKKQSKEGVSVNIISIKKLSKKAKKLIGNRPVYDISLSYGHRKKITDFENGTATIYLYYKPKKKEVIEGLYAVYVDKKGKVSRMELSKYDTNSSSVIFTTKHLSVYGVGYTSSLEKFDDTKNH